MKDTYLTISKPSEGVYKEKGSKFLAYAYPVSSEDDIRGRIEELKKQYHDARHHCFAFILGFDGSQYRANDDGEPNHSAGDPILGQIRSRELTNTLVVVVRYFGGTKLGVSGLINAYKTAAAEALENNEITEKQITKRLHIRYGYEETNAVMKLISDFDLEIAEQKFEADCEMKFDVRLSLFEEVCEKIKLLPGVSRQE